MLQGWTLGQYGTIALYKLNRVMGDVHGAIVKCWSVVAGTLGRHQNSYALHGALTASPPSQSFPRSPPDLFVAGPAVPRDTGGITVQWSPVTGRSFN